MPAWAYASYQALSLRKSAALRCRRAVRCRPHQSEISFRTVNAERSIQSGRGGHGGALGRSGGHGSHSLRRTMRTTPTPKKTVTSSPNKQAAIAPPVAPAFIRTG